MNNANFDDLKKAIGLAEKIVKELDSSFGLLEKMRDDEEKMIKKHIKSLGIFLKKVNKNILFKLEGINIIKPLKNIPVEVEKPQKQRGLKERILLTEGGKKVKGSKKASRELSVLEKVIIKRIKQKREKVKSREVERPKAYPKIANKYFYKSAKKSVQKFGFDNLRKDLTKTNLEYTLTTYISLAFFSTTISLICAFVIFLFLLFFKLSFASPIIAFSLEGIGMRFLEVFWILIVIPLGTFGFMYFYPSLEKQSLEKKINHELPFATIHMSAISQSMLEPSKIFEIILATKEYPNIGKEFTKVINKINVYGYDLVTSLRSTAETSPSQRVRDLFNGLATTITSGGDLRQFFEKRSQTLLFEHKLEREKETRSSETFMDVYISVVIAAPMILMLLLMMMKISGLGIALSTSSITLVMVLSVTLLNVAFISFLHLKKSA
jgi:archaeal flagellar protein FlaJ